jgi:hypothetical protein
MITPAADKEAAAVWPKPALKSDDFSCAVCLKRNSLARGFQKGLRFALFSGTARGRKGRLVANTWAQGYHRDNGRQQAKMR